MEEIISKIHKMDGAKYVEFMKTVHSTYPGKSPEITNNIVNYWKNKDKKDKKVLSAAQPGTPCRGSGSKPQSSQGAAGLQNEEFGAGSSKPWQKSAWNTGFIFRGDKVPAGGKLFLDVEKVTLKRRLGQKTHTQKAATIALVNDDGKLVLWGFIKIDHHDICQYSPQITNLNERKLGSGVSLEMIQLCLQKCLKGNILVGAAIDKDLESLSFSHADIFDIQSVYRDGSGPFALGLIASKLLHNRTGFQQGNHSAIDDARMTLAAYKYYVDSTENDTFNGAIEKLSDSRAEYKNQKPKFYSEKCNCKA